ncbi:hypothetical protein ACIBED_20615 [Rhodococcus coprophilus]|uniref:hypothetical protein n=1 Tax=Rhodococcus coprophilus TaxID=38310 RepID=UPI0037A0D9D2
MAQWFEGFDGQVVLDDDYVWILREGIPANLIVGVDSAPRRAHRGAVTGTDFRPATATDLGTLRVCVRGVNSASQVDFSDPVRFSLISNDRFSTLALLLGINKEEVIEPVTEADQLRAALAGYDGIATHAELAAVLGGEPDVMKSVDGVTWNSVGSLWVAAGGAFDTPADIRLQRIRALQDLARHLPADAGTKTLQSAVAKTPLQYLGMLRLGRLWEAEASEALPARPVVEPAPPRPNPARSERPRAAAPSSRKERPRTRVWTKWDDVDARGNPRVAPEPGSPPPPPPAAARPVAVPAGAKKGRVTAFSGRRIRVNLDCDGHRVKALFDLQTRETEITVAPVDALLGSVHPDPDAAAEAVITAFRLGEEGPFDGWSLWKIDDSSGRPLDEVPRRRIHDRLGDPGSRCAECRSCHVVRPDDCAHSASPPEFVVTLTAPRRINRS